MLFDGDAKCKGIIYLVAIVQKVAWLMEISEQNREFPDSIEIQGDLCNTEPMVRNFFTKLFHGFLLNYFSIEEIYSFYQNNFYSDDSSVQEFGDIDHFWNEQSMTSVHSVNALLNAAEMFFVRHSLQMYPLFSEFLSEATVSNTFLNGLNSTIIQRICNDIDIKKYLLKNTFYIADTIFFNAKCHLVSISEKIKYTRALISLQQNYSDSQDTVLDSELLFAMPVKYYPFFWGLNPFSSCSVLFNEQSVKSRMINPEIVTYENGKCIIQGDEYGYLFDFNNFVSKYFPGLSLNYHKSVIITIVVKDYFCPVRKRVILKKNGVYGAPFSLISVVDYQSSHGYQDISLVDKRYSRNLWSVLDHKHEELIKRYKKTESFVFDKSRQIMYVNEKPLVGGVQAKILATVLKLYINKHYDMFEWRDLAAVDELICDPFSTGLSTRLSRLINTLQNVNCCCKIVKSTRGKYKLTIDSFFTYIEK